MGIHNCFVVWITYIRILISPFTIDSWELWREKKRHRWWWCCCYYNCQHCLHHHHHHHYQQQDAMNRRNKTDENPTKQSRNKRYFSANIKFIDVYFMLYASQIPRIGFFFVSFLRSFIRWCVSAASAIADTVIVVTVVVFYLSFDCYRKRHSFDRFVYVSATLSLSLSVWGLWKCLLDIYFINYIIDYILRVICANENFVLQLILCRSHSISNFLSHIGMWIGSSASRIVKFTKIQRLPELEIHIECDGNYNSSASISAQ